MTRGFVLGKFMPPHAGHVFLCDFGRAYVDELTVLVCSLPTEPIAGEIRHGWMRELFPDCRVLHLADEIPQTPDEHPEFWPIWRRAVRARHPEPIDVVFASEPYGERLAAELDARFVPVDPHRLARPVSGSAVRADPMRHWEMLPGPVRPYFVRRVCLFGPESTGKTTLARRLADEFGTLHVPEYGRVYTDAFGTAVGAEDLRRIAAGHRAATRAASRQANRVLILDTDPILTGIWSEMLTGDAWPEASLPGEEADLYLLTDVDLPWADDGTRYFPDAEPRRRFFERCRAELSRRRVPTVHIHGDGEERFARARAAVAALIGG